MSDTFGALAFPVGSSDDDGGDPALRTIGLFLQAVINADLGAAWARADGGATDPVEEVFVHDPRRVAFSVSDAPCLSVFRGSASPIEDFAADFTRDTTPITVLWVLPTTTQERERVRSPLALAFGRSVGRALRNGRHPAWVAAGDLADPDAIKLSTATSTSVQSYTGAALDGAVGAGAPATARNVTVTTTVAVGAYNVTDPIVLTGVDQFGDAWTEDLYLTDPDGGETIQGSWKFGGTTTADAPAQALATGAISFGYAADPTSDLGSIIEDAVSSNRLRVSRGAQVVDVAIRLAGGSTTRIHQAVEVEISDEAFLTIDTTAGFAAIDDADDGIGLDLSTIYAETGAVTGQRYAE